jgi:two-component system nitrate/nitrite response regulator NarL
MRLLLVDDHTMFREGLHLLLPAISPHLVIDDATTLDGAIAQCRQTSYCVVLLDLGLTDSKGVDTLVQLREAAPETPVVVLSGDENPVNIRACIEAGALGYLPKTYGSDALIKALRFILDGGVYVPAIALQQTPLSQTRFPESFSRLSHRQREVAQLMLQGLAYKVIAQRLRVSEGTVKAHVSAILQIVGARSRVEAVLLAARDGLVATSTT